MATSALFFFYLCRQLVTDCLNHTVELLRLEIIKMNERADAGYTDGEWNSVTDKNNL